MVDNINFYEKKKSENFCVMNILLLKIILNDS